MRWTIPSRMLSNDKFNNDKLFLICSSVDIVKNAINNLYMLNKTICISVQYPPMIQITNEKNHIKLNLVIFIF